MHAVITDGPIMHAVNEYENRDIARAFGLALRATRKQLGMSQEKLSEICGLSRTSPSLLERGLRCPNIRMLFRLA
jgi:DNA-binding XRE family transcriptional regulator